MSDRCAEHGCPESFFRHHSCQDRIAHLPAAGWIRQHLQKLFFSQDMHGLGNPGFQTGGGCCVRIDIAVNGMSLLIYLLHERNRSSGFSPVWTVDCLVMGDDKRTAALCRGLYHLCDGFHKLITFTPDMGGGDAAETRCDGRKDCKFRRAGIAPGRILKPIGDSKSTRLHAFL